jgi:4-aminobutyrate aminotransferase-like enzyme
VVLEMTYVMHRTMAAVPPTAVHADGIWSTDATGKTYLDTCGGATMTTRQAGDHAV